jgi:hypothetical protein
VGSGHDLDGLLVPDALEEASDNLVAAVVTLSVIAMVAIQALIR